jgi:hypothetical protein
MQKEKEYLLNAIDTIDCAEKKRIGHQMDISNGICRKIDRICSSGRHILFRFFLFHILVKKRGLMPGLTFQ